MYVGKEDFEYEYQQIISELITEVCDTYENEFEAFEVITEITDEDEVALKMYTNLELMDTFGFTAADKDSFSETLANMEKEVVSAMWESYEDDLLEAGIELNEFFHLSDIEHDEELEETYLSWLAESRADYEVLYQIEFSFNIYNSEEESFTCSTRVETGRTQTGLYTHRKNPDWFDTLYKGSFEVSAEDLDNANYDAVKSNIKAEIEKIIETVL